MAAHVDASITLSYFIHISILILNTCQISTIVITAGLWVLIYLFSLHREQFVPRKARTSL